MRRVSQRYTVEVDDKGVQVEGSRRGDCVAACLASIFELPIETFPPAYDSQWLFNFLATYYPGITVEIKDSPPAAWTTDAPWHQGYWIAHVLSTRFKVPCQHCSPEKDESTPPFFWRRDECPYCDGSGNAPGQHAVVMENRKRVWDPHPHADWDSPLTFVGHTLFTVSDVSRIAPRHLPPAFKSAAPLTGTTADALRYVIAHVEADREGRELNEPLDLDYLRATIGEAA